MEVHACIHKKRIGTQNEKGIRYQAISLLARDQVKIREDLLNAGSPFQKSFQGVQR
jgi:hypothetical protein